MQGEERREELRRGIEYVQFEKGQRVKEKMQVNAQQREGYKGTGELSQHNNEAGKGPRR